MIGRNDFHFGGQVESIGGFIDNFIFGGFIKFLLTLAIICGIISVPAAAIKYLFWG